ncbi:MAG: NAD-dependent epimerase/dehydratase family protein [Magnetococcales bacterium]|nr:NAD-dependent epimerase/dehydratase family protein [Magnetococcales bacterium]MBF0157708.1 NAD-dependent epimerase/dehydratase family protein [Magnetococcales bacterium]
MAHYLVTGGCGFIGSHLVEALLAEGHAVRILDNLSTGKRENVPEAAEIVIGDVADGGAVARAMKGADGCFHLAAVASVTLSNEDWLGSHRANLTGTIQVLEVARHASGGRPIPVVYASSAAVYGDNPNMPLAETAAIGPLTAYGADKFGSELHARVGGLVHGVPTTGFRFFNVYGPRQDPSSPYSGVISIFVDRVGRGDPITIFGDGSQLRDFVYVADVVAFCLKGLGQSRTHGPVYNVCTGRSVSILSLAKTLFSLFGHEVEIRFAPARSGDIRVSVGNPELARQTLGAVAGITLAEGLGRMLAAR